MAATSSSCEGNPTLIINRCDSLKYVHIKMHSCRQCSSIDSPCVVKYEQCCNDFHIRMKSQICHSTRQCPQYYTIEYQYYSTKHDFRLTAKEFMAVVRESFQDFNIIIQ